MNRALLIIGSLSFAACGSTGSLSIHTYGESYIEDEIPADEVEDGFSIRYTKFLVVVSQLEIADRKGNVGASETHPLVFDLTAPGPHPVATFEALEAQRWDAVSVTVAPAPGAQAGNASPSDVALMNDRSYSVYVEGQTASATVTKTFAWGFDTATRLADCTDDGGMAGVVIPSGGTAEVELTIHGDHFFYDGLQNPEAVMRASAIVGADANGDGEVTLEELAAVDLTTLPEDQYETGGAGSVENLRQFVTALSRTLVHFQGEGECVITNAQ